MNKKVIWLNKLIVAESNEFGETQLDLESPQQVLGHFLRERTREMEKTREFYPMITKTVKTILELTDKQDSFFILYILKNYPNFNSIQIKDIRYRKNTRALLDELDRQYARWNKGGVK